MLMNPTRLLRFLGIKLGISHSFLEVTSDFMLSVVREVTLKTFSSYYPRIKRLVIDSKECELPNRVGYIRIPPELLAPSEIRFIIDVIPDTYWRSRENYVPYNTDVFTWQQELDMISATTLKTTFNFYPPNILDISPKNLYFQKILLYVATDHDKNFYTIEPQLEDVFKELALIDVKSSIYNIRKNFPNLTTVFGNIEVELDSLSDMESKRMDLEEKLRKMYYKSPYRRRIYTG